ncbi:MAG TPA: MlaD family protein [Bacteroidales bacterium]|nr:MlaD family protein [Bacteroidales bacterium]
MKISRELKIGVIGILTIALFFWGLFFLQGTGIFSRQIAFYAVYDHIDDLLETNPVTINGVIVGQVNKISFHPDGSGKVLVRCMIEPQIAIPSNSIARLAAADLIGTREIQIILGTSQVAIVSGDTLQTEITASLAQEVSEQLLPLRLQAEQLFGQVDSVINVIYRILDEGTRQNIVTSFESLANTLTNLESSTHYFDSVLAGQVNRLSVIFANAESITSNLRQNNEAIANVINNLSVTTDTLAAIDFTTTMHNVNTSMEGLAAIVEKINRGEGTMGLLVHDDQLYHNIQNASQQLDSLIIDIQENPRRYLNFSVFGRRN